MQSLTNSLNILNQIVIVKLARESTQVLGLHWKPLVVIKDLLIPLVIIFLVLIVKMMMMMMMILLMIGKRKELEKDLLLLRLRVQVNELKLLVEGQSQDNQGHEIKVDEVRLIVENSKRQMKWRKRQTLLVIMN